jgi:hypothetical protein
MSAASDKYEKDVAENIHNSAPKTLTANRPKVSTSYPDVLVEYGRYRGTQNGVWVEVKMNHTDNMMNPRFQYVKGEWQVIPSYESEATKKLAKIFNDSKEAQEWIKGLKKYLIDKNWSGDINNISLHSTTTARNADKNSVPLMMMKGYLSSLPNKNVCKVPNVDIGNLVSLHYLKGKAATAYYLSSGDDFYQFGNENPLKIPDVPKFESAAGLNQVVLRIGDRSANFEIQAEVKAKTLANSKYSVKPGSSKINPFKFVK